MVCFAGVSLVLRKDNFLGLSLICELENNLPFSSLVSWDGMCAITAIPQFPVYILAIIVQASVKRKTNHSLNVSPISFSCQP